jgi:hypothetical protein
LASAYEIAGTATNALGLCPPVAATRRSYHGRPITVIHGERFAEVLCGAISDPSLRSAPLIGSADQFLDNTHLLARSGPCRITATAALARVER